MLAWKAEAPCTSPKHAIDDHVHDDGACMLLSAGLQISATLSCLDFGARSLSCDLWETIQTYWLLAMLVRLSGCTYQTMVAKMCMHINAFVSLWIHVALDSGSACRRNLSMLSPFFCLHRLNLLGHFPFSELSLYIGRFLYDALSVG